MDGVMGKLCWLVCLILVGHAWGQGFIVPVQQALGKVGAGMIPMSQATITVCAAGSPNTPCSPVLSNAIFKDAALTQPLSNPFNADINGNYQFAIAPGQYTVTVTASGFNGYSYQVHLPAGIAITPAQGQALVGGASGIISQTKPTVDVRDTSSAFDCTGISPMDTPLASVSATAHMLIPVGCIVRLSSTHSYPQTIEFARGGQLKPDNGVLITLTGPIIAGSAQIFSNAIAGQGGIDFTGNVNTFDVLPEWWGAATTASAATNTTALQAAIYGAFGCNVSPVTTCRTNGANTSFYNKRLYLAGKYSISGELHWYHTLNFVVQGSGRLQSGIIQTANNARIIDGQSNAYGVFRDISFSSTGTQDLSHPLADFNFDGSQGVDLKPQFMDFYSVNWSGGGVTKIGVRIAAAGSSAQGSNFEFWNNLGQSFTEAAYMIGNGSNCTATALAQNAISIEWHGGDMQGNNAFGIEDFGGNNVVWDGGTAENGGDQAFGAVNQTGADFCATGLNAGGGPFSIRNMRSESQTLMSGAGGWELRNVQHVDNQLVPAPGGTGFVGDLIEGSVPCSHGYYNKITVGGAFSGLGTVSSPRSASSGSATTLVDSVGGLTVNAWTGFNVCIQGGTGIDQFCTVTSNTATTFTCSAGFFNDFPTAGIVAPDNTTTYTVEPNWGTATTDGTVTFARDDTTYLGVGLVTNAFLPGRKLTLVNGGRYTSLQMTRADFAGTTPVDTPQFPTVANIDVGSPTATGGGQAGIAYSQGYGGLLRSYTLPRVALPEQSFFLRQEFGTRVLHLMSGVSQGGNGAADIYLGTDPVAANKGDFFINNASSTTTHKWTYNYDGSMTLTNPVNVGGGVGMQMVETATISGFIGTGVPVKADTANAQQVTLTTTTDTGSGVVVGVCTNANAGISAGGICNMVTTGLASMTLGTGTCSIGQLVIVDTTTNGRVKCVATSAYVAGTVIGVATQAQPSVGSIFNVAIGLR